MNDDGNKVIIESEHPLPPQAKDINQEVLSIISMMSSNPAKIVRDAGATIAMSKAVQYLGGDKDALGKALEACYAEAKEKLEAKNKNKADGEKLVFSEKGQVILGGSEGLAIVADTPGELKTILEEMEKLTRKALGMDLNPTHKSFVTTAEQKRTVSKGFMPGGRYNS